MYIKIILDNSDELFEEDAHLDCGYFEIGERDFSINLFKDGSCMVMLTLSEMCDFLADQQRQDFRWVGEDNGKYFSVKKQKGNIMLRSNKISLTFDIKEFERSIKQSLTEFISMCKLANKEIENMGGFIDLKAAFNRL